MVRNYRDFPSKENDFMQPSQRGYLTVKGGRTPILAGPTPLANAQTLSLVYTEGALSPEQADDLNAFYDKIFDELRAYQAKRGIPLYPKR